MTLSTLAPAAGLGALDDAREVMALIGAELYSKQSEMMEAVFTRARVSVAGCNGSGKDFTAARLVLAWLVAFQPSKVIVMAPTWRQVDAIVWNEMRSAYRALSVDADWGLRMFPGSPQLESVTRPQDHFAVGFATSERVQDRTMPMGAGLQGFHSPHLLVVVSEGHAVAQSHITALQRLNAQCFLMTGNPFATAGEFFDSHHGKRELYSTIQISALDVPNLREEAPYGGYPQFPGMVTKRDVERRAEDWGEDSPLYQAGVLGEFPDNLADMIVVPLVAAKEAAVRETEPTGPVVVACDVARFGKDKTVVLRRQGSQARIVYRRQGNDTMATAGWLGRYILDNEVDTLVAGLMSLLEPFLIIGMGLTVGFIVIALFLPLIKLMENIQ